MIVFLGIDFIDKNWFSFKLVSNELDPAKSYTRILLTITSFLSHSIIYLWIDLIQHFTFGFCILWIFS